MSASSETTAVMPADVVLHARPAAGIATMAMGFTSAVSIEHGDRVADAASIFALMALGATGGSVLTVRATGDDAVRAVQEIAERIATLD